MTLQEHRRPATAPPPPDSALDVEWFVEGARERPSAAPPSSRKPSTRPSEPPPEPIGDQVADQWFR